MSNLIFESLKSVRNKYKGKIDIHIFDRFIREGFTVVEWGGDPV